MKEYSCRFCNEILTVSDLKELKEMGEKFYRDEKMFICPDCYDSFSKQDLESQFEELMGGTP